MFTQQKIKEVDCITHSGGGICLSISLINNPEYSAKIKSITLFGCQAFGAAVSTKNYIKIFIAKYISKLIGYIPANKTGSEENEAYYIMKQWFNWNLNKNFIGENGFDYRDKMQTIKIPVLAISGKNDTFIAPPKGCQQFLDVFKNPNNKHIICATENGFLEDYNHSRLLHSRNARKEIYPKVLNWLQTQQL